MHIITHDGIFHASDVMACAILSAVYPGSRIIRTREFDIVTPADVTANISLADVKENNYALQYVRNQTESADIYVDVGEGRFSHRQKGGSGQRANGGPYAAAGLVWKEFGKMFVEKCCPDVRDVVLVKTVTTIDETVIRGIDARDNGVLEGTPNLEEANDPARVMSLAHVIAGFNPVNEAAPGQSDIAFERMVKFAEEFLRHEVLRIVEGLRPVEDIKAYVKEAKGPTVVFEQFVPRAAEILAELAPASILYFVSPLLPGMGWCVQQIPVAPGKAERRKPLPKEWHGLYDAAIQKISGVSDATFCHPDRFIAGARSQEGALALAVKAAQAVEA